MIGRGGPLMIMPRSVPSHSVSGERDHVRGAEGFC